MYIESFSIRNIKCFEDVELTFPGGLSGQAGWHVLLGINGTGKSTLLQAMALAMLGHVSGIRLLQQPASWVRTEKQYGEICAELSADVHDKSAAGAKRKTPYKAHLLVTGVDPVSVAGVDYSLPQVALYKNSLAKSLNAGPYSNRHGWFSAGYGPFRRLTGSDGEDNANGQGREARHHTLFSESAALARCEKWLTALYIHSTDPALAAERDQAAKKLANACKIINQLLPDNVQINNVTSKGVTFSTRHGATVFLSQLSDGYRSFLALAIDLLRHILDDAEHGDITAAGESIDTEGVVLIDEADAHLHPTWQRDLGFKMCEVFPKVQFIVSTHSPFVAQAAKKDGLFVMEGRSGHIVVKHSPEESVRGWRADQILLSPLFGLKSTRDPETEDLIARQASLSGKKMPLKKAERNELNEIEQLLRARLTAPGDTYEERERAKKMQAFIDQRLADLAQRGGK